MTMSDKLADELLHMILVPSLTIPHDQFVSPSPSAFGKNDMVSSASVLLVCKRWLRVATPLLYESVVIRSTGQTHALADAFRQNPTFALYVKRIRLEGAFASLKDILMRCENLKMLVILLRIYCDANVRGLCRALPSINPRDVILSDQWNIDNAKIRSVFISLCESIPKWTNLTTFEYPYQNPSNGSSMLPEYHLTRRDRLIQALAESKSLRVISCAVPYARVNVWQRLATIPSVSLRFRYRSDFPEDLAGKKAILNAMEPSELSNSSLEFVDVSEPSPSPRANELKVIRLPVSSATAHVWSRIFAFATVPGLLGLPDVFYGRDAPDSRSLLSFNTTRKSLSLVCKAFARIVRPTCFSFPLISNSSSLHRFAKKVLQIPWLGHQVQALFLAGLYDKEEVDQDLCALFPHLISLRHYIGSNDYMSSKAFTLLAQAAGSTLLTITNLTLRNLDKPLSSSVLSSFTRITRLDITSRPSVLKPIADLNPKSLSTLRDLRLRGPSELLETISDLGLPCLRYMTFHSAATPTMEICIYKHGLMLEELNFAGFADLPDVLINAPNLRVLRWRPMDPDGDSKVSTIIAGSLSKHAMHEKLRSFTLEGIPDTRNKETEQTNVISTFFGSIDLARFPSMKEIHFVGYDWPVEGHAISKDPLPRIAVQIKGKYNVDIRDRSGKPWRPRVQKRGRISTNVV